MNNFDLGYGYTLKIFPLEDEVMDVKDYIIINKNDDIVVDGSYEDGKDLTLEEVAERISEDFYNQQIPDYEDFNPTYEAIVDSWELKDVEYDSYDECFAGTLIVEEKEFDFTYSNCLQINGLEDNELSSLIEANMEYLEYEIDGFCAEDPHSEKYWDAHEISNIDIYGIVPEDENIVDGEIIMNDDKKFDFSYHTIQGTLYLSDSEGEYAHTGLEQNVSFAVETYDFEDNYPSLDDKINKAEEIAGAIAPAEKLPSIAPAEKKNDLEM